MEQTVTIPADHQLHIAVPPEFPAGKTATIIVLAPENARSAIPHPVGEGPLPLSRIGFLKGRVSVPADFDTMGQGASSPRRRTPVEAVEYCRGLAKRMGCTATSDDFLEQRRKDQELEDEQYRRLYHRDDLN